MNAQNGRYAGLEVVRITTQGPDGIPHDVAYTRRRVIPDYADQPVLAEHRVADRQRLDVITALYAGDPERFWVLCDANNVLSPEELERVGRVIRIPLAKE
ncbi:hypothetical protein ABZ477_17300 [Microbacterium sp. NPDC019599]|uniref:hypothetical protein n=1 Tax=Microbacterium sp. NPDC019599 TaxID=3154690 RepID=UPI0033FF4253